MCVCVWGGGGGEFRKETKNVLEMLLLKSGDHCND